MRSSVVLFSAFLIVSVAGCGSGGSGGTKPPVTKTDGGMNQVGDPNADSDGDGYTPNQGDCSDHDPSAYPGATELCDGVDQDCDSTVDFGSTVPTHYATIQDAIDHASSGTHVCVLSGSYVDTMFVKNRTGLIVEGQDRDSVLFDGKLSSQAVQLRNSSVTVRNCSMAAGR